MNREWQLGIGTLRSRCGCVALRRQNGDSDYACWYVEIGSVVLGSKAEATDGLLYSDRLLNLTVPKWSRKMGNFSRAS
jgi:hypothetical protein